MAAPDTTEALIGGCMAKVAFATPELAKRAAKRMRRAKDRPFHFYRCDHCRRWHVGSVDDWTRELRHRPKRPRRRPAPAGALGLADPAGDDLEILGTMRRVLSLPLSAVDVAARRAALVHYFGLSPSQCEILFILIGAAGGFVTAEELADQCKAQVGTVLTRISRLRDVMNAEAIDFEKGRGYRLTDVAELEISTALECMARSLSA